MKIARAALLGALLLVTLGAGRRPPGLGDVTDIRVWEHANYTRVVVDLSERAAYRPAMVGSPPRLYVDIEDTWIEAPLRDARFEHDGAIQRVRGGQNSLTKARIVLELDMPGRAHRVFHLDNPYRIVIDIYRQAPDVAAVPGRAAPPDGAAPTFDSRPVHRIAIDPGHGGKDPGAIGNGIREKDVVLRTSRELEKLLDAQGYDAFLTRNDDRYLTLEQRTQVANDRDADLFVSIHANAARSGRLGGVETYLLDTRYDRQTARVAARENGTTVDQLNDLQRILASLRLGYNERYAARLAEHVQHSLVLDLRSKHSNTRDLGVKRGPFLVLFMADMPAVLVELGFLTNKTEARRMRSRSFAQRAARGIARGISAHRDEHARSLVATR